MRIYGVECHFQQYFRYIMAVILLVEENGVSGENLTPTDDE